MSSETPRKSALRYNSTRIAQLTWYADLVFVPRLALISSVSAPPRAFRILAVMFWAIISFLLSGLTKVLTPPPSPPPTSVPALRNSLPLSRSPKTSSTSSRSPPRTGCSLTLDRSISYTPNLSRWATSAFVESRTSCSVVSPSEVRPNEEEGAFEGASAGLSHLGTHDGCEEDEERNGESRDWRKEVRETGGAGDRRMEVRRRGRSMFEVTWYISNTTKRKLQMAHDIAQPSLSLLVFSLQPPLELFLVQPSLLFWIYCGRRA